MKKLTAGGFTEKGKSETLPSKKKTQTFAEELEKLNISDNYRVDVFLAFLKMKPAVDVHLYLPSETDEIVEAKTSQKLTSHTEEEAYMVADTLGALGMHVVPKKAKQYYGIDEESGKELYFDKIILNISMSKRDAKVLSRISDKGDLDAKTVRKMGELSGFSQTAIDAYVEDYKKNRLGSDTSDTELIPFSEQEKILEGGNENFQYCVQYRLSRKSWQEEIKVAEKWCTAIKEYYPQLYARIRDI